MKKNTNKSNPAEVVAKNGYPEVGKFSDKLELQKFYKKLDTAVLEDWAKLEGLEYKACPESEPIHRMRVATAILNKHFPKAPTAKKESIYKALSLEQLINMAAENDVLVEVCEDEKILRMRLIMGLRAHKVIS